MSGQFEDRYHYNGTNYSIMVHGKTVVRDNGDWFDEEYCAWFSIA